MRAEREEKEDVTKTRQSNLKMEHNQLARISCGKILHVLKTSMAAVSNAPSYKPTQFLPEGLTIRDAQTNKFHRW